MKKLLIFLFIIFFALNTYAKKGGNPLIGKWESSDSKDYLIILMDDKNKELTVEKDGFNYRLTKENNIYTFKNKSEYVQVYLNPSNGYLKLISNNKKLYIKK